MKKLSKVDIRYLAGFFDGEGSVGIYKDHGYHRVRIQIANKDIGVLEWVKSVAGNGHVYGNVVNNKTCSMFQTSSGFAINLLRLIYPYLKVKRNQVELVLTFESVPRGYKLNEKELLRRDDLANRVNRMNSMKGKKISERGKWDRNLYNIPDKTLW